jgi:hypothetical protein
MPISNYKKKPKKPPPNKPKRKTSKQDNIRTGSKPYNRGMNLKNSTRSKLPILFKEDKSVFV